jgi:hypothetical protein
MSYVIIGGTNVGVGQMLGGTNVGRTNVGRTNVGGTFVCGTKVTPPSRAIAKPFPLSILVQSFGILSSHPNCLHPERPLDGAAFFFH